MIQFDKDGVTLVGYDSNGSRFAHNYLEGTLYDNMLCTRSAQLAAARENTQAVANYSTVLGTIQASVDAGRPHDSAPNKPLQKVVSDMGDVSYVPFVPPLADLVVPVTTPSGSIVTPTVDKQAIMYNMILAMFRKEFPEA
jgi:hypothetical protein